MRWRRSSGGAAGRPSRRVTWSSIAGCPARGGDRHGISAGRRLRESPGRGHRGHGALAKSVTNRSSQPAMATLRRARRPHQSSGRRTADAASAGITPAASQLPRCPRPKASFGRSAKRAARAPRGGGQPRAGGVRCGAAERPAIDAWAERLDLEAADLVLVPGAAARASYLAAGISGETRCASRRLRAPARAGGAPDGACASCSSDEPFRDGIRVLFEAWSVARPDAELVCLSAPPRCVRGAGETPGTQPRHPVSDQPPRAARALYDDVDCCVLPTLHDGYSAVVQGGIAAGRPACSRPRAGLRTSCNTARTDGWWSGSIDALAEALALLADRARLAALEEGTLALARAFSRTRYERTCAAAAAAPVSP